MASVCVDGSAAEARISDGLTMSQEGVLLTDAVAVASDEPAGFFFVAGELDGDMWELPGDTGVWVTNDLESGEVFAVNGVAREFSGFPVASEIDPLLSDANPAAQQAVFCSEFG